VSIPGSEAPSENISWIKPLILAVAIAALIAASRLLPVTEWLESFLSRIDVLGPFAPIVLGIAYFFACVLFIPAWILTLGAGIMFGVVKGVIVVSISSTLGASASFLIGRYLARDLIAGRIAGNARFAAIDEAVGRDGWKIVGLARLSPIIPFAVLNYAFGLTQISLKHFTFASWIGMLPGTILFVYAGAVAGDLAAIRATNRERSNAEWILYGFGLLATIVISIILTRIAHWALKKSIEEATDTLDESAG
jgi:uncharacterized membrane protein YdjX (TVP38/TMEM64 family)